MKVRTLKGSRVTTLVLLLSLSLALGLGSVAHAGEGAVGAEASPAQPPTTMSCISILPDPSLPLATSEPDEADQPPTTMSCTSTLPDPALPLDEEPPVSTEASAALTPSTSVPVPSIVHAGGGGVGAAGLADGGGASGGGLAHGAGANEGVGVSVGLWVLLGLGFVMLGGVSVAALRTY